MKHLTLALCIAGLGFGVAACDTTKNVDNPTHSESYAYGDTSGDTVLRQAQTK